MPMPKMRGGSGTGASSLTLSSEIDGCFFARSACTLSAALINAIVSLNPTAARSTIPPSITKPGRASFASPPFSTNVTSFIPAPLLRRAAALSFNGKITTENSPLRRRPSAIQRYDGALHESSLVAAQIPDQGGDLFRRSEPPDRLAVAQLLAHLLLLLRVILFEEPLHKRRLHGAGRDAVHAQLLRVIHRKLPRHRNYGAFAGAVGEALLHADLPGNRSY